MEFFYSPFKIILLILNILIVYEFVVNITNR